MISISGARGAAEQRRAPALTSRNKFKPTQQSRRREGRDRIQGRFKWILSAWMLRCGIWHNPCLILTFIRVLLSDLFHLPPNSKMKNLYTEVLPFSSYWTQHFFFCKNNFWYSSLTPFWFTPTTGFTKLRLTHFHFTLFPSSLLL